MEPQVNYQKFAILYVDDEDLVEDSLVFRYRVGDAAADGLKGDEGTFNMCSFWYAEVLARRDIGEEATRRFADQILSSTGRLERFLKQHHQLSALSARVLEINPRHPLIRRMAAMAGAEERRDEVGEIIDLLLDQARIAEGEPLPDPGAFSRRMSAVLAKGLAS